MARDRRRASLPEVLGAWLRVWTPPRDVEVPPVPVRKLAIGAVVAVLTLGAAAAVIVPAIDSSKERASARERSEREALLEERRRRTIAVQRPRVAAAPELRPAAGADDDDRVAARAALVQFAEERIAEDADRRAAAGEISGNPGVAECEAFPPREEGERPEDLLGERTGVYDCLVVLREIPATETNPPGKLGYPFRVVLDFRAFRATWCRTHPVPGELVIPDPDTVVRLPAPCRRAR